MRSLVLLSFTMLSLTSTLTADPLPPSGRRLPPPPPVAGRNKPLAEVVVSSTPAACEKACSQTPPSCSTTLSPCDHLTYCFPGTNSACLEAEFRDGQAWRACIYTTQFGQAPFGGDPLTKGPSKGLAIGPVDFRPAGAAAWQRVLYTAGIAEIFTGYDNHKAVENDTRIYDTKYTEWTWVESMPPPKKTTYNWSKNSLTPDHTTGRLVTLSQDGPHPGSDFGPRVAAECRDRGIAWLCHGISKVNKSAQQEATKEISRVRRGEELVLWGVFDAGNYDYIQEFGFRDDGTVALRTGATGANNLSLPNNAELPIPSVQTADCDENKVASCGNVPHIHDVLWRVDLDLHGGLHDQLIQSSHVDGTPPFDQHQVIGQEGSIDWDPLKFTSLVIEDTSHVNKFGHHPGYAIHPLRFGNARQVFEQQWAAHDFWITRWHPSENTSWADKWQHPGDYFDGYITKAPGPEPIQDTDVVLWYLATTHHHPTDEDRQASGVYGVTLTRFMGLELSPHNVFPANPLGAPPICDFE